MKKILLRTLLITTLSTSLICSNFAFAEDTEAERAFNVVKEGYTTGNKARLEEGIKMMEVAADHGSGESAFGLAVYHSRANNDKAQSCYWTMRAANLNYADAYWGAAACEMRANKGGDKLTTYDKFAIPWMKKTALEAKTEKERAEARKIISDWNIAKREAENGQGGGLSSILSAFGIGY